MQHDVVHCSIGVSFSASVCQRYPAHSNAVFECVILWKMMWNNAALVLASLIQCVKTNMHTSTHCLKNEGQKKNATKKVGQDYHARINYMLVGQDYHAHGQ